MKRILFLLVTLVCISYGQAYADLTLSYNGGLTGQSSDPYPNPLQTPLSYNGDISLNQFNSALGTLDSVTIKFSSIFNYGTKFSGNYSQSTVTKIIDQWLQIVGLGQTLLDTGAQIYNKSWTVNPGTPLSVNDTNGATNNQVIFTGPALASFLGTGNLLLGVYSNATFSGGFTGGNGTMNNSQSFATNATVTYDYTPTPIPAAVWLLGSGLMGLFGLRRKVKV
jgi:hypothetical protein